MLYISPRIPNQPFADLPTEEEILDFLRFLGHSHDIRYLTDVNVNKLYQPWRSFASVSTSALLENALELTVSDCLKLKCYGDSITKSTLTLPISSGKILCIRINWHYVRDDALFSTIKVVSRHQTTQQYGAILPIELTTAEIRNNKAYKEYHTCAMGEAAPKPKVSARKKKGDSASSTTPPTPTPTTTVESAPRLFANAKGKQPSKATTPTELTNIQRTEAARLKIVLRKSRQETHISQQRGYGTDEGTGSKPGVPDVPSDDSEEELSWKSSDDEDVGSHEEGKKSDESDDDRDEGSDNDSDENALVEAYDADKAILDTYGDSTILKRIKEDDDQEGPSAGPNQGSKRQKEGEEPVQTTCQMEEPLHPVYETGADEQPIVQTSQHPEWFFQPRKPPSPDRA
nr:hypothetical protein [Tanacetum cinerariifolium]